MLNILTAFVFIEASYLGCFYNCDDKKYDCISYNNQERSITTCSNLPLCCINECTNIGYKYAAVQGK